MRRGKNERGAAVVEFAIVLPILLLMLLSMIDFGRYFYTRISLSSASFEVADAIARGLILNSDDNITKQSKIFAVVAEVSPGIAAFAQLNSNAALDLQPLPTPCPNPESLTVVKLSTPFNSISPLSNFFTEASASSTLRCIR